MKKSDAERKSHRLLILITKSEYELMTRMAKERKISRAELIRVSVHNFDVMESEPVDDDSTQPLLTPEHKDTD